MFWGGIRFGGILKSIFLNTLYLHLADIPIPPSDYYHRPLMHVQEEWEENGPCEKAPWDDSTASPCSLGCQDREMWQSPLLQVSPALTLDPSSSLDCNGLLGNRKALLPGALKTMETGIR